MNPLLISALVSAALGFSGAWKIQSMRISHAEKQRLEIAQEAQRLVHRVESQRSAQVITAQNDRARRESKLRLDGAASSAAVDSLRVALHAAVLNANTNPDACADTAATFGELLTDSGTAYSELAGACDRHVSDIQTLIDSHPKE